MKMISAVIITLNEESNIAPCIESLSFCDEIVVVDSRSSDDTVSVASQYTTKIYSIDWKGFASAKNYGIDQATHDWIFSIDADERVSNELGDNIMRLKASSSIFSGYTVNRKTWYLNRWIEGGGWYPDRSLRLFNRKNGRFREVPVHESVVIEGNISHIEGDLLHYSYNDVSDHVLRIDKYSRLCAEQWKEEGRSLNVPAMIFRPVWEFVRKYFLKQGFRDGIEGIVISGFHAFYVFLKFVRLYELMLKDKANGKDEH